MNRNVVAGLCVISVKSCVESFYVVIKAGPGDTLDRNYADGVFVTKLNCCLGVEGGLFKSQRHCTHFNLPKLGEFFPYNLIACRYYEIRLVKRFALFLTAFTPANPCCDTAKHTGFG